MLLVNILEKAPPKNARPTFTVLLVKLLVHAARGENEQIDETLAAVASHYDETETIRGCLAGEVFGISLR